LDLKTTNARTQVRALVQFFDAALRTALRPTG
jgi:hypothetical protein